MYKFLLENPSVVLEIKPSDKPETKNFEPSKFWCDEYHNLWCYNPYVGRIQRDDLNELAFNTHIVAMLAAGFEVTLTSCKI
jgi:hypothetical protein